MAGLLRRDPRMAPWSIDDHAGAGRDRAVDERALARAGHAGEDDQHPERDVDVDVAGGCGCGRRARAGRLTASVRGLEGGAVAEVTSGDRVACPQPLDAALEDDPAAGGAGARAQVDDVVGDRDRLRLVLDDEDGVALVAQPQQQLVHARDVMGVQADRRLVEDVGHIGQRGAQVAHHLDALRFTARKRARRAVERRGSRARSPRTRPGAPERRQQRCHGRFGEAADPRGQVARSASHRHRRC